jgi:hypothetical protein
MLSEASLRDPVLINTIGHSAGVLLFGFIIVLLVRDRRSQGLRETKLSILAAALAFGWNVGSLIALGAGNSDSLAMRIVMTASFAVLSLLPAVLLEVALQGQLRMLTNAGYVISGLAVSLRLPFWPFYGSETSGERNGSRSPVCSFLPALFRTLDISIFARLGRRKLPGITSESQSPSSSCCRITAFCCSIPSSAS